MTAYIVDTGTGAITFPDGFVLLPPYDDQRYFEYAAWVGAGNTPVPTSNTTLIPAAYSDIEVTPVQAKLALVEFGLYDSVVQLMAHPDTPSEVKIKWEYSLSFRRNDPSVLAIGHLLGIDAPGLDALFLRAEQIR